MCALVGFAVRVHHTLCVHLRCCALQYAAPYICNLYAHDLLGCGVPMYRLSTRIRPMLVTPWGHMEHHIRVLCSTVWGGKGVVSEVGGRGMSLLHFVLLRPLFGVSGAEH